MHLLFHYQQLVAKSLKNNWTCSVSFQYSISMLYLYEAQLKIFEKESTLSNNLN